MQFKIFRLSFVINVLVDADDVLLDRNALQDFADPAERCFVA
jgi:hypothetical protein